jgi:hypothetical protein
VTAGLAIYDTMQYIASPVHTYCMGQAASMGSLLLAGGEKGHRYALRNSSVMIHRKSTTTRLIRTERRCFWTGFRYSAASQGDPTDALSVDRYLCGSLYQGQRGAGRRQGALREGLGEVSWGKSELTQGLLYDCRGSIAIRYHRQGHWDKRCIDLHPVI